MIFERKHPWSDSIELFDPELKGEGPARVSLQQASKRKGSVVKTIRVLIVDDDSKFREVIRELLAMESDMEVIGEAGNGLVAIQQAKELKPDLILMDVRMPGVSGLEVTRRLTEEMPGIKIIILTLYDLIEYREAALANGAVGYVIKKSMLEDLVSEIKRAFLETIGASPG